MNEIKYWTKFRVWNEVGKRMTDSGLAVMGNILIKEPGFIVMQFTGLKDINGKEIYEGDIITWFADGINKKAIVKWYFNGYIAKRIDKEIDYSFQSFIPIHEDKFDGEVIGNIYENPELIVNEDTLILENNRLRAKIDKLQLAINIEREWSKRIEADLVNVCKEKIKEMK